MVWQSGSKVKGILAKRTMREQEKLHLIYLRVLRGVHHVAMYADAAAGIGSLLNDIASACAVRAVALFLKATHVSEKQRE